MILPVQRFTYMLFFTELSFEIADGYAIVGLSLGQQLPEKQNLSAQVDNLNVHIKPFLLHAGFCAWILWMVTNSHTIEFSTE